MVSLYIHIPFCAHKCSYCSFQVLPVDLMTKTTAEGTGFVVLIEQYVQTVCTEIRTRATELSTSEKPALRTIYFGGGTPLAIGTDNLIRIIDTVRDVFSCTFLEELSIEMNPYPAAEVYHCIEQIQQLYKDSPRIRWSFGIQTFDPVLLAQTGREGSVPGLIEFLRNLVPYKKDTSIFNFDFIAFGKAGGKKPWSDKIWNFFHDFVQSGFADSFSLYMLELHNGSERFHKMEDGKLKIEKGKREDRRIGKNWESAEGSEIKSETRQPANSLTCEQKDDAIHEEFQVLKDVLLDGGYERYETSNFAYAGKRSIHNTVYRTQGEWVGVGTSAVSQMKKHRQTNTSNIFEYIKGNWVDEKKTEKLTEQDMLIERVMLGLRMKEGIRINEEGRMRNEVKSSKAGKNGESDFCLSSSFGKFVPSSLFVPDREQKITVRVEQGLCRYIDGNLRLTDVGMDVANMIVTELLAEV